MPHCTAALRQDFQAVAKVVIENICKIYPGGIKAVDNANLTIEDREFVVLVGPSGCGKSTVLTMAAGLNPMDAEGRHKYTGHVFRVSGCRHQARRGVQVASIMAMARWDSHVVLRYLKGASLTTITAEYKRGARGFRAQAEDDQNHELNVISIKAMKQIEDLKRDMLSQDARLEDLKTKLALLDDLTTPKYIVSEKYKKWHVCLQFHDLPVAEWRVRCGWRYGNSVFERRMALVPGARCSTCFEDDGDDSDCAN